MINIIWASLIPHKKEFCDFCNKKIEEGQLIENGDTGHVVWVCDDCKDKLLYG